MRLSKVATLALIVATPSLMSVPLARSASDCSISVTLANWGENSTGYIDLKSGGLLDQARLVRIERQREVLEPLAHIVPEAPGVRLVRSR